MKKLLRLLEHAFRHWVVYPLLRMVFHNPYSDATVDLCGVRKILILRYDRIGDMIVTTPVFRQLKRTYPDLLIGVFASPSNAEIALYNPFVYRVHILSRNWMELFRQIRAARKENYDVVLNFIFNRTTSAGLLANAIAPRGVKVGQGAEKYRFYFNRMLSLPRSSMHMVEVLAYFVRQTFGFECDNDDLHFDIAIDPDSVRRVDEFLRRHNLERRSGSGTPMKKYVVVNFSATDSDRKISSAQTVALVRFLVGKLPVVIISAPGDFELRTTIARSVSSPHCYVFPEKGNATLRELASLVEGSLSVFTPDTSIIHFASAMRTPVMGFFTPLQVNSEWHPYRVKHSIVRAPEGMPASQIPVETIEQKAAEFLIEIGVP